MTEQRYLAGGICTTGTWNNNWCMGWLPLPKRNMTKEDKK